jgi:hypothetical protein
VHSLAPLAGVLTSLERRFNASATSSSPSSISSSSSSSLSSSSVVHVSVVAESSAERSYYHTLTLLLCRAVASATTTLVATDRAARNGGGDGVSGVDVDSGGGSGSSGKAASAVSAASVASAASSVALAAQRDRAAVLLTRLLLALGGGVDCLGLVTWLFSLANADDADDDDDADADDDGFGGVAVSEENTPGSGVFSRSADVMVAAVTDPSLGNGLFATNAFASAAKRADAAKKLAPLSSAAVGHISSFVDAWGASISVQRHRVLYTAATAHMTELWKAKLPPPPPSPLPTLPTRDYSGGNNYNGGVVNGVGGDGDNVDDDDDGDDDVANDSSAVHSSAAIDELTASLRLDQQLAALATQRLAEGRQVSPR